MKEIIEFKYIPQEPDKRFVLKKYILDDESQLIGSFDELAGVLENLRNNFFYKSDGYSVYDRIEGKYLYLEGEPD